MRWLAFGLLLYLAACRSDAPSTEARSGLFDPPRLAPAFTLQGSNGKPLSLADHRGKIVILEFGFTFCEQVCPVTLAHLVDVFEQLGDEASQVQLVFVTVDPARDSPERLAQYLSAFHPSFLGATGPPEVLQAMRKDYGIVAEQVVSDNPKLGYQVNHSSFIYLVDRQGMLAALIPFDRAVKDIVADIELLLQR